MRTIVTVPALDMGKDIKENKGKPTELRFFVKEDDNESLYIMDPKNNTFKVALADVHKALSRIQPRPTISAAMLRSGTIDGH